LTTADSIAVNTSLRVQVLLLSLCLAPLAVAQDESAGPDEEPTPKVVVATPQAVQEAWGDRVERLIEEIFAFEKDSGDADDLFRELDLVLHDRIHRINDRMRDANSPEQPVNLEGELPPDVTTIADLHANIDELYTARLRLLDYLSEELHLEVTATDVIGVEQLALEIEFIWEQIRFRALNLPAAVDNLARRVQIAPLPVIWRLVQFLLVIAAFRWWRKWLPETMRRMQSSLAEIRPRSAAVMRRIRFIWYIEQIRRPLEWMLVTAVLFAMAELQGLNLMLSILQSIVQWVLLGWFAVSVLNAFSARGAAGLSGADESIRLRSLQLIAGWLVLLGLGLDLANDLTGAATLHAWVWRLFQLLALPVLLILLAWWRKPIFLRLERESENSEPVQRMLRHQRGLRSFGSAANGAFWLLANNLRRSLMRTFLRVGDGHGLSISGAVTVSTGETIAEAGKGISDELRESLLAGCSGYEKHARTERRRLIRRANNCEPGIVAVVGERGIGKSAILQDLVTALPDKAILLECNTGQYSELEGQICKALSIKSASARKVSDAMRDNDIRLVAVQNLHRLSRPVFGGQAELKELIEFVEEIKHKVLWATSIDSFAWQFLRRVRADQASIHEVVTAPSWTEDQIAALIEQRIDNAGLEPDFSAVQIPPEHAVSSYDTAEERNKAGIYRMLWTVSGGNPAVALLAWTNCLHYNEDSDERVCVGLPALPSTRELDSAAHNVMLVLRCIAQSEMISEIDIVDNLRLPQGAVGTAMHYCNSRGWIEESDGRYRISMQWFRAVTRALARQNLLAR
jgi:hypothetical protein